MRLKIAFIMDPFEKLDKLDEDTSCSLILECLRRGHEVFYLQVPDLKLRSGKVFGTASKILERKGNSFLLDPPVEICLNKLQAIFMRKDPPFNLDYLYTTYILEYSAPCLVINNPRGIRDVNEKLYVLNFPEIAPQSMVTKNPGDLKKFLLQLGGKMIIKPLNRCSGEGILYLQENDINLNSLLEMATERGTRFVIAQEYLPEVKNGDKRILLLEGEPIGAMCRIPPPDDYRANIHRGARFFKAEITTQDRKICHKLASRLVRDGIYFAGVDIIGEKVVEVNVTSPAGIPEINKLNQTHLEEKVIDWVEEKVRPSFS